jgi:hypothetical protein
VRHKLDDGCCTEGSEAEQSSNVEWNIDKLSVVVCIVFSTIVTVESFPGYNQQLGCELILDPVETESADGLADIIERDPNG